MIRLGTVELSVSSPCVIAVLDSIVNKGKLEQIKADGAEIVEIRFDLLHGTISEKVKFARLVKEFGFFGVLGTARETAADVDDRLSLIELIEPYIDAIDEEVSCPTAKVALEKCSNKLRIVSHHDYKQTPPLNEICRWADTARSFGADVVKLAFTANTKEDLLRIKEFSGMLSMPSIIIAMGSMGVESRLNPSAFNSLATYAFVGKEGVAPGQLSVSEAVNALKWNK